MLDSLGSEALISDQGLPSSVNGTSSISILASFFYGRSEVLESGLLAPSLPKEEAESKEFATSAITRSSGDDMVRYYFTYEEKQLGLGRKLGKIENRCEFRKSNGIVESKCENGWKEGLFIGKPDDFPPRDFEAINGSYHIGKTIYIRIRSAFRSWSSVFCLSTIEKSITRIMVFLRKHKISPDTRWES
ncbi:hypothetical protein F511_07086 [Dorcoceras hygrometricum]|nr:hypothetical protein F511_07086 [Dorcoceras hygrometricum]